MENLRDFANKLEVPYGYKQAVRDIKSRFTTINYRDKVRDYSRAKTNLGLKNAPNLISDSKLQSSKLSVENTTFLKQARYFGQLAKNATKETKPLLYHYAENSLFAFFVYSIFSYPGRTKGHGLDINLSESLEETTVTIKPNGFFARIIDCYTILGVNTHFSSLRYEVFSKDGQATGKFDEKGDNPFPLFKEPKLNLEQLIGIRQALAETSGGHYYDIVDFVLLFFGSSLARYRPYFWHELVEGEKGTQIIWFEKCFDRFDFLVKRLIRVLFTLHWNYGGIEPPYPLNWDDISLGAQLNF